jgi:hypothetical protein
MKTDLKGFTFFDTDMHLHKISTDYYVKNKAKELFNDNIPTASSEFSLVELKGNYIGCLILLRRKINDSESLSMAFTRVDNTGGRRAKMMLTHLIRWIDEIWSLKSWDEAKRLLITYLDSQIAASWEMFKNQVDFISDDLNCTRAKEEPEDNNGNWSATIHRCKKGNTNCNIDKFFQKHKTELVNLNEEFKLLDVSNRTPEIYKIQNIAENILKKGHFNWEGSSCRKIGDLIIALNSKSGKKLITSNYKEHSFLSKALNYQCEIFKIAEIRKK